MHLDTGVPFVDRAYLAIVYRSRPTRGSSCAEMAFSSRPQPENKHEERFCAIFEKGILVLMVQVRGERGQTRETPTNANKSLAGRGLVGATGHQTTRVLPFALSLS